MYIENCPSFFYCITILSGQNKHSIYSVFLEIDSILSTIVQAQIFLLKLGGSNLFAKKIK